MKPQCGSVKTTYHLNGLSVPTKYVLKWMKTHNVRLSIRNILGVLLENQCRFFLKIHCSHVKCFLLGHYFFYFKGKEFNKQLNN